MTASVIINPIPAHVSSSIIFYLYTEVPWEPIFIQKNYYNIIYRVST